jgi:hypothetical protein
LRFLSVIHLPNLETRVRLIRRDEALEEIHFTRVFLFLIYDVYVTTVSSLINKVTLVFLYHHVLCLIPEERRGYMTDSALPFNLYNDSVTSSRYR